MNGFQTAFGFLGHIGRQRFWVTLALALPSLVGLFLASYAYDMSFPGAYENGGPTPWPDTPLGWIGVVLWFIALAALLLALLSAVVRRLHDRGKAWWWLVPFFFLPGALSLASQILLETPYSSNAELAFLPQYFSVALTIWALVELGFLPGTRGPARSDPDLQAEG